MDKQAHPLSGRISLLAAAIIASLLVAGGSFVVTWRNWSAVTEATDQMMAVTVASRELQSIYDAMAANAGALMTGDSAAISQGEAYSRRFDEARPVEIRQLDILDVVQHRIVIPLGEMQSRKCEEVPARV